MCVIARYLFVGSCLCLLAAGVAAAQSTLAAGIDAGASGGLLFGSVPVYPGGDDCGTFSSGSTVHVSGGAHLAFPSLLSDGLGLSLQIGWLHAADHLQALPIERQSVRTPQTGELVVLDRHFALDASLHALEVAVMMRISPGEHLRLAAGPWVRYGLSNSFDQTDNVTGPGDIRLAGGQPSQPMLTAFDPNGTGLGYGLKVSGGWVLPAGGTASLIPTATASLALRSPTGAVGWGGVEFGAGASLEFDLTPHPAPVVVAEQPPPPHVPLLSASIDLHGVDADGNVSDVAAVSIDETFTRRYVPLLAAMFFNADSATIAPRYRTEPGDNPSEFKFELLRTLDIEKANRYVVAVLARRLLDDSAARLTVHGSASGDEPPELARRRAESVRDELVDRWGVRPQQIRVTTAPGPMPRSSETSEEGREENRRVEFSSDDPTLLEPIATERIARNFDPPTISLTQSVNAEAGVRRWTVDIEQADKPMAHYEGTGDPTVGIDDLSWTLSDDRLDSIPSPIRIDLTVEDSTGNVVTAHDELPLVTRRHVQLVEQRGTVVADETVYSLVAFDYNSDEPTADHRKLLALVANAIPDSSTVQVIGYADPIGGERYNENLSRRRAESVADVLRTDLSNDDVHDVTVNPRAGGVESQRFGSDLPEQRMLSRSVEIRVATHHQ